MPVSTRPIHVAVTVMFSVIIPLYNKEAYVRKAVNSVLGQTFGGFELIVIDDGSTDKSRQQLDAINDPRLTVISQPNAGVSAARNRGAASACHSWLAFLDADDWWHPDFLKELAALITNYPNAVLYGSNYFYVKNGQNKVENKALPPNFTAGYLDYVAAYGSSFCVPINCSFVVVSKTAFDAVGGFNPALQLGEDFDLWIRLALVGKVAYVNQPLAYSNQDVDATNRAIGGWRLYPPQSHVIFNLSFLRSAEAESPPLKQLIDGLRVRSLLPYHLAGRHTESVNRVLAEVNFAHQPLRYRFLYQAPVRLINGYVWTKQLGSVIKRVLVGFRKQSFIAR